MFYLYVIKSLTHNTRYIGTTDNINKRLGEHNQGKCRYTSGRRPWQIVYNEEYDTRGEATKRERFLKSGRGRKYLDNLLKKIIVVGSQPKADPPQAENPTAGAYLLISVKTAKISK